MVDQIELRHCVNHCMIESSWRIGRRCQYAFRIDADVTGFKRIIGYRVGHRKNANVITCGELYPKV